MSDCTCEWYGDQRDEREMARMPPPQPHVLKLRNAIRLHLGCGGARFPGAEELYEAARKIEQWEGAV